MTALIDAPNGFLASVCERNGVQRLALFGSALRRELKPDSDIDLLVEFEPARRIGWIGMAALELELEEVFGRKVDLRTYGDLSQYFREAVRARAEVLYEA